MLFQQQKFTINRAKGAVSYRNRQRNDAFAIPLPSVKQPLYAPHRDIYSAHPHPRAVRPRDCPARRYTARGWARGSARPYAAADRGTVRTGRARCETGQAPLAPDIPTVAESGIAGFEAFLWYGIVAPAQTPPYIVSQLAREIAAAMALPEIRERLVALGSEPADSNPSSFAAFIKGESEKWGEIVRSSGVKAD